MALAKYAEDIQEAIYERMAMREREYTYDSRTVPSRNEGNRSKQEGGELHENIFAVRSKLNKQNGKESFYVR